MQKPRKSASDARDTEQISAHGLQALRRLRVSVGVDGPELGLSFQVTSNDSVSFDYEVALHTYLRVADVRKVRVHGLAGASGADAWPAMLCIEAANTGAARVTLTPGAEHVLETTIFAEAT